MIFILRNRNEYLYLKYKIYFKVFKEVIQCVYILPYAFIFYVFFLINYGDSSIDFYYIYVIGVHYFSFLLIRLHFCWCS